MTTRISNHNRLTPACRIIVSASFSAGLLAAASSLSITSPVNGRSVSPGSTLPVTVAATGPFTEVVVLGEGPIGFSRVLTGPNFQFNLPIPACLSPGQYSLTALGVTSSGNVSSTPVIISVERTDAPIEFDVKPVTLSLHAGERMPLRVIGTYADGTKLDITHSATTGFSSNGAGVVSVDSQGNVTAVGPGSARIFVNGTLSIPVAVLPAMVVGPQWPVLYGKQSMTFSAFQPGMAGAPLNWSINPQVGSINAAGVYSAPSQVTGQQAITITATLKSDPTMSASAGVALYPPVGLSVSPSGPMPLKAGGTTRFAQTLVNALDQDVDWSISPKGHGSIDRSGLYTAPATVKTAETVTITATSIADPSKTATSTVGLQP